MDSTKITQLRDGWHKNNSQKGWTDGELNGKHENNSPKDGELNSKHENNSPKGWMDGELNGQHENNLPKDGELIKQ